MYTVPDVLGVLDVPGTHSIPPDPFAVPRKPVLTGERVHLRPLKAEELRGVVARMAADPGVSRWWSSNAAKLRHWLQQQPHTMVFVIEERAHPGLTLGVIQASSNREDPDYESASLDIALFEPGRGKGLGPDALRTAANWLFTEHHFHRITIDPAAENRAAVRAYEKAGFKRIGLARCYERGDDGEWHDNVLLDMLPEDLAARHGAGAAKPAHGESEDGGPDAAEVS